MRPTLHEYNLSRLSDLDCTAISDVLNFTKLTNRAPKLKDFIGKNAIFKGEWDAAYEQYYTFVINRSLRIRITFCDDQCDVSTWDIDGDFFEDLEIHRIEDLPREIEFKEGLT